MNHCPAEIWIHIFTFACLDDGRTGRSLSLVSRYIRDISRAIRLQSVAVHGLAPLCVFADMLEKLPDEFRRVRYLYLSNKNVQPRKRSTSELDALHGESLRMTFVKQDFHPEDEDALKRKLISESGDWSALAASLLAERRELSLETISRILRIVARTLRVLTIHTGPIYPLYLHQIQLPVLEELTIQGSFIHAGLLIGATLGSHAKVQTMPSLKYLHLADCANAFAPFIGRVPNLTHLRVSRWTLLPDAFNVLVSSPYELTQRSDRVEARALAKLEKIIIVPVDRNFPRVLRNDYLRENELTAALTRGQVLRLQPQSRHGGVDKYGEALGYWLDRISGGEGCWHVRREECDMYARRLDRLF